MWRASLEAIEVTLVDAVYAYPARSPMGPWCLAHADGVAHRARLGKAVAPGLVTSTFAQVVQVRDRQARQTFIAGIAIDGEGPVQEMCNGRATDVFIGAVHLYQQFDVAGGVLAGKGGGRGAVAFGQRDLCQAVVNPACHQAGDLGATVAAGAAQVGQHHTTLAFAALRVVKRLRTRLMCA